MTRPSRRSRLVLVGALASLPLGAGAGCELDGREPLDLDGYARPSAACVHVIHDALELGGPIHRFVADADPSTGGWALVTAVLAQGPGLVVERVPASPLSAGDMSEGETPVIDLELPAQFASAVELVAGTGAGELWVLAPRAAGGSTVLHLEPVLGVLARNDAIANFPGVSPTPPCPTSFARILVLARGQPYLLAAPDCSPQAGLVLHLLALEPDTLSFEQSWEMQFDPCLGVDNPSACALALAYSLPELSEPRTSLTSGSARVPVGLSVVRALGAGIPSPTIGIETHDVSLLDMRLEPDGPVARLVTFPAVWPDATPTALGPPAVGEDLYSTQLLVRNLVADGDAALIRLEAALDRYVIVRDALPFAGAGELIQLRDQSAVIHVEQAEGAGTLAAVGLGDVKLWPRWAATPLLTLDDLIGAEQAGVGKLLLRRSETAPQLVSIDCL